MRRYIRRKYYDLFSPFYDAFVTLHSGDRGGVLREMLAETTGLKEGNTVLDICTGTGSLLVNLQGKVGEKGRVIGVDFSRGMLKVAKEKTRHLKNVFLVEADVSCLPFKGEAFDAVTCSHAFYELKGEAVERTLQEVRRVLKEKGPFLMMEHEVPSNPFIKALFFIRLLSMGRKKISQILRDEEKLFRNYFKNVERLKASRSKIIICRK